MTYTKEDAINFRRAIFSVFICTYLMTGNAFAQSDAETCETLVQAERFDEAADPCTRAAENGDASAQSYLGLMYMEGHGVKEDAPTALSWWLKSAQQGHPISQYSLGILYWQMDATIPGIPKDPIKAFAWFSLSGFALAGGACEALAVEMTPTQLKEAQELKKQYLKKYPRMIPKPQPSPSSGNEGEEVVLVKGGCFEMGSTDGGSDEKVHKVCLDDFYMDRYEVTQSGYEKVAGNNPSYFSNLAGCPLCPVENVNWREAQAYCTKAGKRLPTEAEWEYAATSGGKKEKWAGTGEERQLGEYAWYRENASRRTHPVGEKKPNGLGLYDMTGNVAEWVADWYDEGYYSRSPERNPQGPPSGGRRVLRGGSWFSSVDHLRGAYRETGRPDTQNGLSGFRCAGNP